MLRDRAGRTIEAEPRACPLLNGKGDVQWFLQASVPQESDGAALALQRSLLQHRLPAQQALETAARYLPADPHAGVGGTGSTSSPCPAHGWHWSPATSPATA